jgi:hypothetical protein
LLVASHEDYDNFDTALPKIPQSFIEEYCKQGGIDKVLVEYMDIEMCFNYDGTHFGKDCSCKGGDFRYLPKLNPDNTIIIHPIGDKYTEEQRKDIIQLIKSAFYNGIGHAKGSKMDIDKWIEENL